MVLNFKSTFVEARPIEMPAIRNHRHILSAYRELYRHSLQAVHYSSPARHKLRDIIRNAFRNSPHYDFNPIRVANTIRFLHRAKIYNGYEHKILRNILYVRFWRDKQPHAKLVMVNEPLATDVRKNTWSQFTATVAMLNESQELCLRT